MKKLDRPSSEKENMSASGGNNDSELAKKLGMIEHHYLSARLTEDEKAKPELVKLVEDEFILPSLRNYMSGVSHMGSAYEYTTIPGKSDFDIQFFIKLSHLNPDGKKVNDAELNKSENAAWKFVKGGPEKLLDEEGYLSTYKAVKLIQSTIDQSLARLSTPLVFNGSPVTIKRSTSGPAVTLNVYWRREIVSIDVVVCLKAADVKGSEFDLVAKPYNKSPETAHRYWRMSYSKAELDELRTLGKKHPRAITLLRIMKLLKERHPQLGLFPSYFYKNLLFLVDNQNPEASWKGVDIAARFKEMIAVFQKALQTHNLPLHFNPQVNYLAGVEPNRITVVTNFLERIILRGRYTDLLSVMGV